MRRVLMLGLLMVQGWAGACSPAAPTEGFLKAVKALAEARAKQQTACQGINQVDCTVYNAAPYQVAQWLKQTDKAWKKTGPDWTNENPKYGRITALSAISGGSIVKAVDHVTAWERLEKRLYDMKSSRLPFQNCKSMGLGDSAYQVTECKWNKDADRQNMSFRITSASDKSLPVGEYAWMDFGTCGYSLEGPKN